MLNFPGGLECRLLPPFPGLVLVLPDLRLCCVLLLDPPGSHEWSGACSLPVYGHLALPCLVPLPSRCSCGFCSAFSAPPHRSFEPGFKTWLCLDHWQLLAGVGGEETWSHSLCPQPLYSQPHSAAPLAAVNMHCHREQDTWLWVLVSSFLIWRHWF